MRVCYPRHLGPARAPNPKSIFARTAAQGPSSGPRASALRPTLRPSVNDKEKIGLGIHSYTQSFRRAPRREQAPASLPSARLLFYEDSHGVVGGNDAQLAKSNRPCEIRATLCAEKRPSRLNFRCCFWYLVARVPRDGAAFCVARRPFRVPFTARCGFMRSVI